MSKTFKHNLTKIKNSNTNEWNSLPTLVGESAYELAVRLGTFTGTEEEYNSKIENQRSEALAAITSAKTSATTEITNVKETSITNIQLECTSQINAIQSKGEQTLASIPEDYADLQEQVSTKVDCTYVDEKAIETYFAMRKNHKIYQSKIWKFTSNPTSLCEKLMDNAGLVCEPSTDSLEGRDDYLNGENPLFEWWDVNYIRDDEGMPHPTAIKGMDGFKSSGNVDVGVMQMSFYWSVQDFDDYILLTISDDQHILRNDLNLKPWTECMSPSGKILPWCIGSKYISSISDDGMLHSLTNSKPSLYQSYQNMITNYGKKGTGYHGAGAERNTFQIIFLAIKYATKNSQNIFAGCTNYNYQYSASIERTNEDVYFPVTTSQASNIIVGSSVSVGYGALNSDNTINIDRGQSTVHQYVKMAKVTKIEPIDDANSAVYLDIDNGFNTIPIALSDEVNAPIILSTMPWISGTTDNVIGKYDGSIISNTNGKYPYRIQGREYAIGSYIVASDTVMIFKEDYSKDVYIAPKGVIRSINETTIKSTYKFVGNIPASADGNGSDYWIGDLGFDKETGGWYPSTQGSGDRQGVGDRVYSGGKVTSGTKEYLQGGYLGHGSHAGSGYVNCWNGLSVASWRCCGCD